MGKIIDFPVREKVKMCGDCSKFDWCYAKSSLLFNIDLDDREKSKKIPACDKISL